MFCSNCGEELLENVNFCPNCGKKIDEKEANGTVDVNEKPVEKNESQKSNGMIYAGFAFGLCASFFSFFIQVLGIACGVVGLVLNHISKQETTKENKKYNTAGFIFSIIGVAVAVLIIVISVANESYQQNQAAEALGDLLDWIF